MGAEMDSFGDDLVTLRPFFTSRTGEALLEQGRGSLNFADDPRLFALTALTDELPPCRGSALESVPYRWDIAVISSKRDEAAGRRTIKCRAEAKHFARGFAPFNRGANAAIEAVILATRANLPGGENMNINIMERIGALEAIARKTGGEGELEAFRIIRKRFERAAL
jgi:hypothetical protein